MRMNRDVPGCPFCGEALSVGSSSCGECGETIRPASVARINSERNPTHPHGLDPLLQAYLRGAELSGANLMGVDLFGAELIGANLHSADLAQANLGEADLRGADLSCADLYLTDLSGANLCGADLSKAMVSGVDVTDARYDDRTVWPSGFVPEERGAILAVNIQGGT